MTWTGPDGQPADRPIHTVPLGDIRDHVMDGLFCPCMPRLAQPSSGGIIVHNSYDRREVGEVCRNALEHLTAALANMDVEWTPAMVDAYDRAVYLLDLHWPKATK